MTIAEYLRSISFEDIEENLMGSLWNGGQLYPFHKNDL